MSIHNVTGLDLGAVTQLGSGTYVRDLTIKSSNGGFLQVTLFAQSDDSGSFKALRASFGDRHEHNPLPRTQKEVNYDPINR